MSMADSDLKLGELLGGRYLIEAKVGEGGMGAVYRALDERNMRREVAIKLIGSNISQAQRESAQLRFSREREAALRITHPNVVQVIDNGVTEQGDVYLVQEFIHGESLENILKLRGRLGFDEIVMIVNQVGAALEAAHSEGIVHRDLKPANVMLQNLSGGGKQVKVIDFGIAKVQESVVDGKLTGTGMVIGTPFYASPEQLQSFFPDPKMDLWALAVMTYEMITGALPFRAENMTTIFVRQMEGPKLPKILRPDLPDAVQAVLVKALSYKTEDRYIAVQEYCEALAKAFEELRSHKEFYDQEVTRKTATLPAVTPPAQEPVHLNRPNSGKKIFWISSIAGIVLILGLSVYGLNRYYLKPTKPANLSYSLLLDDGRGKPFYASGREIYRTQDKFKLILKFTGENYLYIFNDGSDGSLTSFFPASHLNGGSSLVKERELRLPEEWFEFDENVGEERLILVISSNPISLMEGLRYKDNIITDPQKVAQIREWLKTHDRLPDQKNEANETILSVPDEPLVAHIELKHR